MATNITDLKFDDGAQINVVSADQSYTWVTSSVEFDDHGVLLEYTESGDTYRVFLPWHSIDRIYQEL